VSHPPPGGDAPSVTGFVSSVDDNFALYVAQAGVQESRLEGIEDLHKMVEVRYV